MGCVPSSFSVPCGCVCCCTDHTCCACCPCLLFLCGCRIEDGRCFCRCDPFRKYADSSSANASGSENNNQNRKAASNANDDSVGGMGAARRRKGVRTTVPAADGESRVETLAGIELTDPVLGVAVRPSSGTSHSTGMEPQVSDDSRTPSQLSDVTLTAGERDDGDSMSSHSDDAEREGVCIDGKFYPKIVNGAPRNVDVSVRGEAINGIISVCLTDEGSNNKLAKGSRHEESDPSPLSITAPRRLAKIDIKEERKKMMSELSKFSKKPKRRKHKHKSSFGRATGTSIHPFDTIDPITQMEVIDTEQSSSSPRSFHISSADDDTSGTENVRKVQVTSALQTKLSCSDVILKGTPRNVTITPCPRDDDVPPSSSICSPVEITWTDSSDSGSSFREDSSHGGDILSIQTGDYAPETTSTGSAVISAAQLRAAGNSSQNPDPNTAATTSSSSSAALKKLAKSRSTPVPHSSMFAATPSGTRPSARGLAMSRHFQGPGKQQTFGNSGSGGGGASGGVSARPQSAAASRPSTGGTASGMTRYDSMWTLAGDHVDPELQRGHSGGNSDQDSVGSSTGRPNSTYGIRAHSEAVHSLNRWRNLKVNPF